MKMSFTKFSDCAMPFRPYRRTLQNHQVHATCGNFKHRSTHINNRVRRRVGKWQNPAAKYLYMKEHSYDGWCTACLRTYIYVYMYIVIIFRVIKTSSRRKCFFSPMCTFILRCIAPWVEWASAKRGM